MKPKTLVAIGGILLLVGAATPWATLTSDFLGISRSLNGLQGDGILSAFGGLVLLLIGLLGKDKPGQTFSVAGMVIAFLCGGLLAWKALNIFTLPAEQGITTSLGFGLTCLSPLGALLGFIGSATHTPMESTPAAPVQGEKPAA